MRLVAYFDQVEPFLSDFEHIRLYSTARFHIIEREAAVRRFLLLTAKQRGDQRHIRSGCISCQSWRSFNLWWCLDVAQLRSWA